MNATRRKLFAIVNPAAGSGRARKLAPAALEKLRSAGLDVQAQYTTKPGHGTQLAREAYAAGWRDFVAVGGDGTAYEIVNGLLPDVLSGERAAIGFLPVGTGNSFLRDFFHGGAQHSAQAIIEGRRRSCDVVLLEHEGGATYSINIVSVGFAANVAAITNRRFKRLGPLGYLLGVLTCLATLDRRAFPLRADGDADADHRRCLFLTFSNSKFTGGKMMIAPDAVTDDGFVEYVRWGPIGRLGLVWNLPTLFTGTHIRHPMASRRAVQRIEFERGEPIDVMVDGEVLTTRCKSITILPGALDVMA